MIRALHLMGADADFQSRQCAAELRAGLGDGFEISTAIIGKGGDYRDALAATYALNRRVRREFELVHAWDLTSLGVAAVAGADRMLFSPSSLPSARAFRAIRAAMLFRHLGIVCPVAGRQEQFLAGGVARNYLRIIEPTIEGVTPTPARNRQLRAELGFSDDDQVVLAPGESTPAAGHRLAMWSVAIVQFLNPHAKVLLWGRGCETDRVARFARHFPNPAVLTIAERKLRRAISFEELPAVCDAAIHCPSGPTATLPLRSCQAAGLQILATRSIEAVQTLRESAVFVDQSKPRILARSLLPMLAEKRAERSPHLADRSPSFAEEYRAMYRFFAGQE